MVAEVVSEYGEELFVMRSRAKLICWIRGSFLVNIKLPVRCILIVAAISITVVLIHFLVFITVISCFVIWSVAMLHGSMFISNLLQ